MEKKKFKLELCKHKIIIIGVFVVIFVVILAIILARTSFYEDISDDYFESDDTKLVLSLNKEMAAYENGEYEPDITRVVYYYNGDKVTGVRVFYDYDSEEEAKEANEFVVLSDKDWTTGKKLNGKYIIFEVERSQYNNLTTDMVRDNIERMRAIGGTVD